MWHLVCGDMAVEGVTRVIGDAAARGLRVLRDDLAVGPLADVERPPCAGRAQFWLAVWPDTVTPRPDFAPELSADAGWLAGLAAQPHAVTVWHGDSCSEQLLLARVAAALAQSELPFWEVPCGTGDSSAGQRRAVGMIRPEEMDAYYQPWLRTPISAAGATAPSAARTTRRWMPFSWPPVRPSGGRWHG